MHGVADRAHELERPTVARAQRHPHLPHLGLLRRRAVDLGLGPRVERGRAQVIDQPDDRDGPGPRSLPGPADGELPADRVLAGPELIRRRAVDHGDGRRASSVLRREATAPSERDAERREVIRGGYRQPQHHNRLRIVRPHRARIERDHKHVATERQRTGETGRLDAGVGLERREHVVEEEGLLSAPGIAGGREPDAGREHVACVEAGVHVAQPDEAAHQQTGAHQQHQGEGHLAHDQGALQPPPPAGRARGILPQRLLDAGCRGAPRRQQAERHAGHYSQAEIEREDRSVESDFGCPGERVRPDREQGVESRRRQRDSDDACGEGEQCALCQQLSDEPPAPRAEGAPDRHLTTARGGARQQQVGPVGARDQQHQTDGAQQDQQRPAHITDGDVPEQGDVEAGVEHRPSAR